MINHFNMLVLAGALALEGSVVTTASGKHAVVVWDASPLAARMSDQKAAALRELEVNAARILIERAPRFRATTQTISVRVVYERRGEENPLYGVSNFAGIVPILTLSARRADALAHRSSWNASLAAGKLPRGIALKVFVNADSRGAGS